MAIDVRRLRGGVDSSQALPWGWEEYQGGWKSWRISTRESPKGDITLSIGNRTKIQASGSTLLVPTFFFRNGAQEPETLSRVYERDRQRQRPVQIQRQGEKWRQRDTDAETHRN